MKHNHSCVCSHTEVKFCAQCTTVYCKGCNQEWIMKTSWTNPWIYTYAQTTGQLTANSTPTGTVTFLGPTEQHIHAD